MQHVWELVGDTLLQLSIKPVIFVKQAAATSRDGDETIRISTQDIHENRPQPGDTILPMITTEATAVQKRSTARLKTVDPGVPPLSWKVPSYTADAVNAPSERRPTRLRA